MIYLYHSLYMDDVVAKHPARCKKRVERRRPWQKNYYAVMLAANDANLFEIMGTRQLFFQRYRYLDMYILGLASDYKGAVKLLQRMIEDICREAPEFSPRQYFRKKDFTSKQE